MRIAQIDRFPFRVPLRRPLVTAGATLRHRGGLVVELRNERGAVGCGEASPHPAGGEAAVKAVIAAVEAAAPTLLAANEADLEALLALLQDIPSAAARAGLETALYDLAARRSGRRLAAMLGPVLREQVPVNATLGECDPQRAAAAARTLVARGFRAIKLKIAAGDPATDRRRVAAVRAAVGDGVALRADANAAWQVDEAVEALRLLAPYRLEYIEQPVADIDGLARVRAAVDTPVAADESVTGAGAVNAIAERRAADVVVLKPGLLGLRQAQAAADCARRHGLDVVVTSTLDTSIGITAALHLAATLPEPLRPCGLATAELLEGDLVDAPPHPHGGRMTLPPGAGLGITPDRAALTRWAR